MFGRRHRLSREDFTAFANDRSAIRSNSEHFSVVFSKTGHYSGAAVVISKKVAKSSVGRHLLKRRIMSVLRPWNISGTAFIVYARQGSATLPFSALSSELTHLFTRLS